MFGRVAPIYSTVNPNPIIFKTGNMNVAEKSYNTPKYSVLLEERKGINLAVVQVSSSDQIASAGFAIIIILFRCSTTVQEGPN